MTVQLPPTFEMLFDLGTVTVCRMDAAIDYAAAVSAADNAALQKQINAAKTITEGQDERLLHHARELGPLMQRAADVAGERAANAILTDECDALREHRDSTERLNLRLGTDNLVLRSALKIAEAALADIGDATREPGDDLAWCERRAARALPAVRAALKGMK
jgi:hypothetical protein